MKNRARQPAKRLVTNIGSVTLIAVMVIVAIITILGKWDYLLSPLYR